MLADDGAIETTLSAATRANFAAGARDADHATSFFCSTQTTHAGSKATPNGKLKMAGTELDIRKTVPVVVEGTVRPRGRDALSNAVRSFDALLRHRLGIEEFTQNRDCIFRIALDRASNDVRLSDGVAIAEGDPILHLHFWNEHLPSMAKGEPNAAWASRFKRLMHRSLVLVARHLESHPEYAAINALHGKPPFRSRIGVVQMVRTARRFGFDVIEPQSPPEMSDRLHQILDSALLWSLAYAFNPSVLRRRSLLRQRYQLWISRATLSAVYGGRAGAAPHQ